MGDAVGLAGAVVPGGDQTVELATQHRQLLVGGQLLDVGSVGRGRPPPGAARAAGGAAARAPGRARAGRGCRGSPSPRPTRRAPRPRGRTSSRRTARGRRSRSEPSASNGSPSSSAEACSPACARASSSPSAAKRSSSSVIRRPRTWSRSQLHLGGEAEQRRAPTAGRSRRSPRAGGPGRSGRRPGRRTAAWRSSWRRRPTASRGTSTPSETIRTATIHRLSPSVKAAIFREAAFSSESTTVGRLPADPLEQGGVGTGGVLVGGDHQAARVGHVPAYLRQPPVRGLEHRRDPRAGRVEGGAQRLGGEVLGERLPQPGRDLVAGAGAPLHLAGVGQEQHRADDVVGQRVGVAVGVVGQRARDAVRPRGVGDERDRVDVGAERRAGQRQPAGRRAERLPHALAPRQRVAGVVDLVEDHQRLEPLGADPHGQRVDRHPGVGDRDADEVLGGAALAGGVRRVDRDARPGPLPRAHCTLRCSVGATTMTRSTMRRPSSSAATVSAKVVLPAPGVATARKSRGSSARYCASAAVCQARSEPAVPQAARSGQAGGSGTASGRPVMRRSPRRLRA